MLFRSGGEAIRFATRVADLPLAEHPVVGSYRSIPMPERFSATPAPEPRPAPLVGQHGRELLTEVGYDKARIDALLSAGVLRINSANESGNSK